ncbi:MAG: tetratricopeptide repeat protein [Bradymonadia bacterium]|jgi:tetratricopeptide (TPR) repeat protein
MGFFDKLLGRNAEWYLIKAKNAAELTDFGQAMELAEKGIKRAKQEGEDVEELTNFHDELRRKVLEQALESAKAYIRAGNDDSAQNCLDRALRHAKSEEEKALIDEVIDNSHQYRLDDVEDEKVEGADAMLSLAFEDKWALYVTSLPFAQAEAYDELGIDFKRAWVDLQEGKLDSAIAGFRKSETQNPKSIHVMTELGRALYAKGEFQEAEKLLTKADHATENIGVKLLRAEILWAMKRFDIAEIVLQAAHDLDPDDKHVLVAIAQHGLIAQDYESGIAAIEALCELLPSDYSVWRLAGRLYIESGDEDKALEAFERVNTLFWKLDPQTKRLQFDPLSVNTAAAIYIKRGENISRALELLLALRENTSGADHIAICLQMAQCYDHLDESAKRDDALEEAERYLDAADGDDPVYQALAQLSKKIRAGELRASQA